MANKTMNQSIKLIVRRLCTIGQNISMAGYTGAVFVQRTLLLEDKAIGIERYPIIRVHRTHPYGYSAEVPHPIDLISFDGQ